jgi:histone acetyltransferase (RNA polymerase elongator complex component)
MKPDRSLIYPLFIPMRGCPGTCVYCDQRKISGSGAFDLQQAKSEVGAFLRRNPGTTKEVAFYGGTFTALPLATQNEYLEEIGGLLEQGDSIRVSTHPAYISSGILAFLKTRKVQTIELGIQDFCDEVLAQSGRDYSSGQAVQAAQAVRSAGFTLGLQLMPGLPGSSAETMRKNLELLLKISPALLRLYPTIVIKGTKLEQMYRDRQFVPLSLRQAVVLCAEFREACAPAGIRIIKYGLPSNIDYHEVVAGPYHPAFGELVKQELLRRELEKDPSRKDRLQAHELQLLRAHGSDIFCETD